MWNRPYVPRLRSGGLPWQPCEASLSGLAPGTQLRILSRDPDDGAMTCLWRLPPGWSQPVPFALAAAAEYFVLDGSLDAGGRIVHRGAYRDLPAGAPHPALRSRGGALVYAMWSAAPRLIEPDAAGVGKSPLEGTRATDAPRALDASGRDVSAETSTPPPATSAVAAAATATAGPPTRADTEPASDWIDTEAMTEQPTPVAGPVPGINVRILRRDAASGGMTLLVAIPRRWEEPRSEHHDCVEESFKLAGDIWLHENHRPHVLEAGDYFFRPPRIKHGPMRTQDGTTSLIRFSAAVVNHYGPIEAP